MTEAIMGELRAGNIRGHDREQADHHGVGFGDIGAGFVVGNFELILPSADVVRRRTAAAGKMKKRESGGIVVFPFAGASAIWASRIDYV